MKLSKRRLFIIMGAGILIGMVTLGGYGYAEDRARPSVEVPPANRHQFSDVFVLLDGTGSMRDWAFEDAKQIVKDQIISSIGLNDTIAGYTLSGEFNDHQNAVFGRTKHDQPPRLDDAEAQRVLRLYGKDADPKKPGISNDDLKFFEELKSRQQELEAKRKEWQTKIDALKRPDIRGSNYRGALDGIREQVQVRKTQKQREICLFIVGDLINESPATTPPLPKDLEAFKDVKIVLIYPFESERDRQKLREFWKSYFGDISFEERTFGTVLPQQFLMPPNPTFGVEVKRGPDVLTLMMPFLIIDVVIILISVGLFFFWVEGHQTSAARPINREGAGVEKNCPIT